MVPQRSATSSQIDLRRYCRRARLQEPTAVFGVVVSVLPYPRHNRLITSGMLRFLLPPLVASTTDDLGHIAYVIAAYNAGCCPRRCWGYWQSAISCSAPSSSASSYRCPSVWHCHVGFGSRHVGCPSDGVWPRRGRCCHHGSPVRSRFRTESRNGTRELDGSRVSAAQVSWWASSLRD